MVYLVIPEYNWVGLHPLHKLNSQGPFFFIAHVSFCNLTDLTHVGQDGPLAKPYK